MKPRRILSVIAAALAVLTVLFSFASCSASDKMSENMAADTSSAAAPSESYYDKGNGGYAAPQDTAYEAEGNSNSYTTSTDRGQSIADTRKIVKTVSLQLETKEFDKAVGDISSGVIAAGGYIESSYISGESMQSRGNARYAEYVLRIPVSVLDSYVSGLSGTFHVVSKNENALDITDTYYDADARLKSLLTQEERLLKMLEGATELQYMLQLEQTLADVRYQIESYYSTLKRYDNQIALSTVTVRLQEVIEYQKTVETPKTYGQRMWLAFTESWTDFADAILDFTVDFVYAIPTLLVLAAIVTGIIFIVRARMKKKRNRKDGV